MFVYLSKKDIDKILELQNEVFKDLKASEKAFLLPKDKASIEQLFDDGNKVIGYHIDGKLVAQAIVLNPSANNPKTGMVDMPDIEDKANGISVLQGVVVHPDYQGHKIGGKLIKYWVDSIASEDKTMALAESAIENFKSYSAFLHAGLVLDSMGVDPDDGTEVFNIKANPKKAVLKTVFNECSKNNCSISQDKDCFSVSIDDVKSLKQAFNDDYIGTHWNRDSKTIQFHKRNNPHSTI